MTVRLERTVELPPGAGSVDWERVRAALNLHRASKKKLGLKVEVDEDGIERVVADTAKAAAQTTVLIPGHEIELTELPLRAKNMALRLKAKGWEVRAQQSRTRESETFYAGDSKIPDGPKAGDPKADAFEVEHFGLSAVLKQGATTVAALRAFWSKDDRPKATNTFAGGRHYDVVNGFEFNGTSTPFEDWVAIFAPKPPSKAKKKAATKADDGNGEYWNG